MRFKAVATDYDGTLASHDRLAASTVAALERVRAAGLRLALATGRTFLELTRVCNRLDVFDVVVAENGGVLYFPAEDRICDMAPGPPPLLLAELDRQGIPYQAGRVVIGTMRIYEADVRRALEATGVTMTLVPNRTALMLLPDGVSKGASLRHVIRLLGLSPRDVLSIGDGENDLDLFAACGFAACPGDAVSEVKACADWIFEGEGDTAVAAALAGSVPEGRLALPASSRHRLRLGWVAQTAEPLTVPARDWNLLVQGDSHAGKSWLAGVLIERLVSDRYAACVIDPEGDYHALAALPGVAWFVLRQDSDWKEPLFAFHHDPSATVVVDLSLCSHAQKVQLIESGLRRIHTLREARGVPHWVVLDEAHYSLHPAGVSADAFHPDDKGFCLVTHRTSWLRSLAVEATDAFILGRTTMPQELAFLNSCLDPASLAILPQMPEHAFLLAERGRAPVTFVAPARFTSHVRHLHKYTDRPVSPQHRFLFRRPGRPVVATASTLGEFVAAVTTVDDTVLAHHAASGDFSRWVLDVFADQGIGGYLRTVERRWARGEIRDLRHALTDWLSLATCDA